jgi:hypothetical protein
MTQKDVDRVMLVRYAVRETGERGSLEQMKAVCYCLRNRVRAGWGDWIDVIEGADEHGAHTPENDGRIDPNNRAYQRLLRDVDDIYFGHRGLAKSYGDTEGGGERDLEDSLTARDHECLYWAFLDRPMRPEFAETIVRAGAEHPNRATMGLMMFYE